MLAHYIDTKTIQRNTCFKMIQAIGGTITQMNIEVTHICYNIFQCMIDYNIPELCMKGICYMQVI